MLLARSPQKLSASTRSRSRSIISQTSQSSKTEDHSRSSTVETEHPITTRHNTPSTIIPFHTPTSSSDSEDSDVADRTINIDHRRHRETLHHSYDSSETMTDPVSERIKELGKKHDNVHKFVAKIDSLTLDGSNLARWKLRTEHAIFDMTGVSGYWDLVNIDQDNPVEMAINRCAGRVINSTIAEELVDLIYKKTLAHDALKALEEMFHQGGRTSQYVIFRRIMLRQFQPATSDLMTFVNEVNNNFNKLKSAGFTWDEDVVKGMVYQLCSPTTGEYGMDVVNGNLDARYRTDRSSFTSSEVRSTIQNVITTRKSVNENKMNVQALATSFQKLNSARHSKYKLASSYQPHPPSQTPSQHNTQRAHGPPPPPPLFPDSKARDATTASPITPSRSACKEVHEGLWQCLHCAEFGHGKLACPSFQRFRARSAPHYNDWV